MVKELDYIRKDKRELRLDAHFTIIGTFKCYAISYRDFSNSFLPRVLSYSFDKLGEAMRTFEVLKEAL